MPSKVSFLFQQTTSPEDLGDARPHTSGWSESFWRSGSITSSDAMIKNLGLKRAACLPTEAAIIGFRIATYTIDGAKLKPTGTSTGKFLLPGLAGKPCDLPQVALQMAGKTAGAPNSSRFCMRGIPDDFMKNGEFQPTFSYSGKIKQFGDQLVTDGWCFLGRNLANATAKVLTLAAGVVTLDAALAGVAQGDYLRFLRVIDVAGKPVSGSFRVTNVAGAVYTVVGTGEHAVTKGSGAARKDQVATLAFSDVEPSRAVVRKVGRPFESYRGRR